METPLQHFMRMVRLSFDATKTTVDVVGKVGSVISDLGTDFRTHPIQVTSDTPLPELEKAARTALQDIPSSDEMVEIVWRTVVQREPIDGITHFLKLFIAEVYELEHLSYPDKSEPYYKDKLVAIIKKIPSRKAFVTAFVNGIGNALYRIFEVLPPNGFTGDQDNCLSYVSFYTSIPQMGDFVTTICSDFHRPEALQLGLFDTIRKQMRRNLFEVADVPYSTFNETSPKLKFPRGYDFENPLEYMRFVEETPLYLPLHLIIPFDIPRTTWASHGIAIAEPGHGKSQLIATFIANHLQDPDPPALILLDPHGDLFDVVRDHVHPDRLFIINPDEYAPPMNFLDFGTSTQSEAMATFTYLISSLSGALSEKQNAIIPYLLKLLRSIPNASLETLRQLVDEKVKTPEQSAFWGYISALPEVDQGFFRNQFYSARMQETKDAIGWKLYSALSSDAFREMFSAPTNSVNFDQLIAQKKVVLVKGARNALGDEGMRVFLQFMIAQYFAAGMRRGRLPLHQRHMPIRLTQALLA